MKTIRESNCLGKRMSSTSVCQKAPKITLQFPHRLHVDDTRGEVQLAENREQTNQCDFPLQ